VGFLAHPLSSRAPGSAYGPDIVPYSELELAQAWQSPAILGLEFWNENDRYRSSPDRLTPTVMFVGAVDGQPQTTRYSYPWPFQGHRTANFPWSWQRQAAGQLFTDLYHGAVTWDRYLRRGLDPAERARLSWLPAGQPRKWFMAGGSDSHGDFNFRRYGTPDVERWTDVPVGDTAIGNPRNLVSMDDPSQRALTARSEALRAGVRRYSNVAVIRSLQAGRFSVTDGPAVRIAIDRNLNNVIDAADTPMGGTFDFFPGDRIPVLIEWLTTPEFGPISRVDLYVGNQQVTFAPVGHGPEIPRGVGRNPEVGSYRADPSTTLQVQLADAYGRFTAAAPELSNVNYHGLARVYLGPQQFQLAQADGALSYVRAFARTIRPGEGGCVPGSTAGSRCGNRFAFSNPIWSRFNASCPTARSSTRPPERGMGAPSTTFVDANANVVPDACEDRLRNVCSTERNNEALDVLDRPLARDGAGREASAFRRPIPDSSCQRLAAVR
jgi:hypothetical protein